QKSGEPELKSIAVDTLEAGVAFSEAVYIDDDNIFVPAGIPIQQRDLDKIASLGVDVVLTAGEPLLQVGSPEGEVPKMKPAAFSTNQQNRGAYRVYTTLIERIHGLFTRISEGNPIDNRAINTISTQLLQALKNQREQYIGFVLGGNVKGSEMAKSAVNIAILSALTAQEIRLPSHKILYIIIGALLHDTGMFQLPKKILEKRGALTEEERKQMRNHPLLSREIVVRDLSYPDEIGDIVLQHHERWDGNGYPHRLPGNNISIGARIVSIADSFEAMVSPKPYRSSILGYQANKNLLADNSHRFDPDILKVFILTMGVYPIGSLVCLNNGIMARITEVRPSTPLRPKIQVLLDEFQQVPSSEEGYFIDLLTEKRLYITKAVDPSELSGVHAFEG
ncbi:MAG: HD-GYP domain-containing protein, partial [Treponema sp.]|nr:HD-GYP domain-containing protein [Treponema sp.]